jgi:hypothetical protein
MPRLPPEIITALRGLLIGTALGEKLVSFKI